MGGQRRPQFWPSKQVEERGPPRRVRQYNVADVQARLAGDDCVGICGLDWWTLYCIGLFSTGPEAVAFSEPEGSSEERLLRVLVVARGLALRAAARGGELDVD